MGAKAQYYSQEELPLKSVTDGLDSWAVALDRLKLTYFEMKPCCEFVLNNMESEQISMVLEGELFLRIGDQEAAVQAGEVFTLSANIEYVIRTGDKPAKVIDAWTDKFKGEEEE